MMARASHVFSVTIPPVLSSDLVTITRMRLKRRKNNALPLRFHLVGGMTNAMLLLALLYAFSYVYTLY